MHNNKKGQVSFEILMLTAVILATVIWVGSYYLSIKDSTLALQVTKIHTLGKIGASGETYKIDKIDFIETEDDKITIEIMTSPDDFDCSEFDSVDLTQIIQTNTKYLTVTLEVNGASC
tara:strand:- start:11848 stop:12201 length:354 start_codon:yes stop_codon:yes gene_type:complete